MLTKYIVLHVTHKPKEAKDSGYPRFLSFDSVEVVSNVIK